MNSNICNKFLARCWQIVDKLVFIDTSIHTPSVRILKHWEYQYVDCIFSLRTYELTQVPQIQTLVACF